MQHSRCFKITNFDHHPIPSISLRKSWWKIWQSHLYWPLDHCHQYVDANCKKEMSERSPFLAGQAVAPVQLRGAHPTSGFSLEMYLSLFKPLGNLRLRLPLCLSGSSKKWCFWKFRRFLNNFILKLFWTLDSGESSYLWLHSENISVLEISPTLFLTPSFSKCHLNQPRN